MEEVESTLWIQGRSRVNIVDNNIFQHLQLPNTLQDKGYNKGGTHLDRSRVDIVDIHDQHESLHLQLPKNKMKACPKKKATCNCYRVSSRI